MVLYGKNIESEFKKVHLATKSQIDANNLGTTNLNFVDLFSLSSALPSIVVIRHNSGTFDLATARLRTPTMALTNTISLNGLSESDVRIATLSVNGPIGIDEILQCEVQVINGLAATFQMDVYGFIYN